MAEESGDAGAAAAVASSATEDMKEEEEEEQPVPKKKGRKRWFPLESNPAVMNAYVERLGFPTSRFAFCDVFSTDDWAVEMVPRPVLAVMMLFPIKEVTERHKEEETARIARDGQTVAEEVYYMRQYVGNACGTIGLLHAVGNNVATAPPADGSWLARFFDATRAMDAHGIASYLEEDDELEETHESTAQEGQSEVVMDVNTHFVAFVEVGGHIYELDGRKEGPVNHGPSSAETLLADACRVVKGFMERDPEELRFTIMALAPATDDG